MKELLAALHRHADEHGHVSGSFEEVRAWVGEHAAAWDVQEMFLNLTEEEDVFEGTPYFESMTGFSADLKG